MAGSSYCFFHHPDKKAERLAAASKGGVNCQNANLEEPVPISLESPEAILDLLALAAGVTAQQPPSVAQGRALSAIAAQALRVQERISLNSRVKALEAIGDE